MKLYDSGVYLVNGKEIMTDAAEVQQKTGKAVTKEQAAENTIAYGILNKHNTSGNMDKLQVRFDKLTSHDITFVGIIQTARASGLERFPMPYVLTNCHNSLCAVGGTINEDDHMFGLTCAKKYGGVYVPPHQAVIHQFAREMLAESGAMILGSDSHTRYGALGTMAVGDTLFPYTTLFRSKSEERRVGKECMLKSEIMSVLTGILPCLLMMRDFMFYSTNGMNSFPNQEK